ncbi:hypothetical protein JCM5296_004773, partial [Sporobolomyces johnsonii]
ICGVGALALYLFLRFHVSQETFPPHETNFPSFTSSEEWFDIKLLLAHQGPLATIDYNTFLASVNDKLKKIGLASKAKTHIFRGSSSRMADLAGANKLDIRSAGRWNQEAIERCYLTGLARETLRAHAGFDPRGGGFFLRRDIAVPVELEKQVFPEADVWLRRHEVGDDVDVTMTAQGFLRLLIKLRRVLLQDAACIRSKWPSHPVFSHPVFSSPAFLAFEETMQQHLATVEDPRDLQLQRVIPHVSQVISSGFAAQRQQFLELSTSFATLGIQLTAKTDATHTLLSDVLSGTVPLRLIADLSSSGAASSSTPPSTTSTSSSAAAVTATTSTTTSSATSTSSALPFTMNRNLTTVDQAWREWTEGIPRGLSVEAAYSAPEAEARRRAVEKEDRFYRRRLPLIQKVRALAATKEITEDEAVKALDAFRKGQKNKSLASLQKLLAEEPSVDIPLVH